jgi:hypothetical protein
MDGLTARTKNVPSCRVRRTASVTLGLVGLLVGACTDEGATPVDLDAITTSSSVDPDAIPFSDDPTNVASRQMAVDFAEAQCFDDPELEEGVIRIVDPESDDVVGEVVADCVEVRAEQERGETPDD